MDAMTRRVGQGETGDLASGHSAPVTLLASWNRLRAFSESLTLSLWSFS